MSTFPRSSSTASNGVSNGGPSLPVTRTVTIQNNGQRDVTHSPLKLFGQAKKKINEAFKETSAFLLEAEDFVNCCPEHFEPGYAEKLKSFCEKVKAITEIVGRNQMKVVFFGRTSNGKSSVINAMLHEKLLPTGIGHTTNCFIQVEGSNTSDAYILTEDSGDPKSIQNISQLAHALSETKADSTAMIRIIWPKSKCQMLKEEVLLVDSPGIDISPDFDTWIDKYCLDADVFVFVSNAESTVMQTEKNFFVKVSDRLSKPNVFILNNRWDASAGEPETMDQVRRQHLERNIRFLVDELKVVTRSEAENRVFFVSAKETIACRLQQERNIQPAMGTLQEGYVQRVMEFDEFERRFEECISHTAIQTKFEQHVQCGKNLLADLRQAMDAAFDITLSKKNELVAKRQDLVQRIDQFEKNIHLLVSEFKQLIANIGDEVNRQVSTALSAEIRRLPNLLDEFERPFSTDPAVLVVYKKEILDHLEGTLSRNLKHRCSTRLVQSVDDIHARMGDSLTNVLPQDVRQELSSSIVAPVIMSAAAGGYRDLSIIYSIDCHNLCCDFSEDIEFHFSLGLTNLLTKWFGWSKGANKFQESSWFRHTSNSNTVNIGEKNGALAALVVSNMAETAARSAVGAVVIGFIAFKMVGWKILVVGGALYGGLYMYERATWTIHAKERAFKQQYAHFCASKLQQVADLTSASCAHQVVQHVQATWGQLLGGMARVKDEWETELTEVVQNTVAVEEANSKSKILRNRAGWVDGELNSFVHNFLSAG